MRLRQLSALPQGRSGYHEGRWRGEGFGIVFIEAGAFGVPSIAGRGDGGEEAVEHGVTGLVVDGGDVDVVGAAIRTVLEDAPCRQRMGEAAREPVLRDFAYPRFQRQLGDFLANLTPRRLTG